MVIHNNTELVEYIKKNIDSLQLEKVCNDGGWPLLEKAEFIVLSSIFSETKVNAKIQILYTNLITNACAVGEGYPNQIVTEIEIVF